MTSAWSEISSAWVLWGIHLIGPIEDDGSEPNNSYIFLLPRVSVASKSSGQQQESTIPDKS